MNSPLPDGMMRTRGGVRIAAHPAEGPTVIFFMQGIAINLTLDDSHAVRDLLQAAELRAARGDVIT